MTTPEKLRARQLEILEHQEALNKQDQRLTRRQRWEGTVLIVVGLLFAGYSYVDSQRQSEQEDCLTDQIVKLTSAIEARGEINAANTDATQSVILGVASATGEADYSKIEQALADYVTRTNEIEQMRKDTKIPPFPNGKCAR